MKEAGLRFVQILTIWCCLVGILFASAAAFQHAISLMGRLVIGSGAAALLLEIWLRFFRRERSDVTWRIVLRLISLLSLTYAGWFGPEAWFRFVEDSGLRNPVLIEQLNRRHLIWGVVSYILAVGATTGAVWLPVGGCWSQPHVVMRRPLSTWAALLSLLAVGVALTLLGGQGWSSLGLGLVGLELLFVGAGIAASHRAAFWAYVTQAIGTAFVVTVAANHMQ